MLQLTQNQHAADVTPLSAGPLHEQVYCEIRRALMAGAFQPGQVITIRGLAAILGTSPMPVREALRRLTAERALDVGPNRGHIVPALTRAKYAEICRVRIALESLAAELAVPNITDSEIDRLAGLCEAVTRAVDAPDPKTYLAKNQEFHFAVYRAAGSDLLLDMISGLWLQVGPTLNYVFRDLGFALRAAGTNNPIVEALRARDGAAAREAVARDISHAVEYLVRQLPESDTPRDDAAPVVASLTGDAAHR